ncbi:hypothetical protein FICEBENF_02687 [Aeromonas hydrophila]
MVVLLADYSLGKGIDIRFLYLYPMVLKFRCNKMYEKS